MESSEAVQALEDGTVSGIFYEEENPFLTVAGSGIEETLLSSLMESFDRNASILRILPGPVRSSSPLPWKPCPDINPIPKQPLLRKNL